MVTVSLPLQYGKRAILVHLLFEVAYPDKNLLMLLLISSSCKLQLKFPNRFAGVLAPEFDDSGAVKSVIGITRNIDLALLDIKLPDIEGGRLYGLLKESRPERLLPDV
ncbi:hypothetical protein PITCH_A2030034 [uncultured Desulfobacterium sp.]|uniref:Response regulatory domain-containing protein n=1 Tax=uncultured Desulfobacterium sp. TaxID=201089 RepID=A0A445MWN2_9BACT|nr:hypothetical protein PITCH_A2030034 [uncultured Desulfobacterium sp.]